MGAMTGGHGRVWVMLGLTTAMCVVEAAVGQAMGALSLVADALHMLADAFALLVALCVIQALNARLSDRHTFGWVRAEVLGAHANAIFLLGLCLVIIIEALKRLFFPVEIVNPVALLVVGFAGLLVNAIGIFMFCDAKADLNLRALALHILADLFGSVIVIFNATVNLIFMDSKLSSFLDPTLSLLMALILIFITAPLIWDTAIILMQMPPAKLDVAQLKQQVKQVDGVAELHELHVWQLTSERVIVTVHVRVAEHRQHADVLRDINACLHAADRMRRESFAPSTRPSEPPLQETDDERCASRCPPDKCAPAVPTCCPPVKPPG